jgi:hypothetical protein
MVMQEGNVRAIIPKEKVMREGVMSAAFSCEELI